MLEFRRVDPASVDRPLNNYDVLFLNNAGVYFTMDSNGVLTVLGNGIAGIAKIGTVGLVDTYRITYTSGEFFDYTITNAKSITSLTKVGTVGLVDTYRITFNDGPAFEYTVTNARSIVDVIPPANPGQPGATDTYTIDFNDGPNDTFIVYNGMDGQGIPTMVVASPVGDTGSAGTAGPEYANPDHVHAHGNQTNPAHHAVATTADNGFMSSTDKAKLDGIAAGAEVNQNAFSVITGNTGTATADAKTDSLAITGVNGLTTTATDTPDGLQISPTYGSPTGLSPDGANAAGTANTFARSDHVHATPADTAVGLNGGSTNGEGTSTSFARADHTHAIANGGTPSTITPDAAANQGAATSLARSDHTHAIAADAPVALGAANAEGTSSSFARADHVHLNPVIAHEAAADPHPQYTTAAEAAAAAPVQSVNGQTGNVTVNVPLPLNANRVGLFTSTANSTAVQPFLTLTIPANRIVAGATYSFLAVGTQSQSAAATNVVFTVQVNGTTIATATVAGGTAAQTNRALNVEGMIQFTAAGAAGQVMGAIMEIVNGIAANTGANVAGVAVNTTANVTITLTAQTSTANAANIIRIAAASISERA